MPEQVPQELKQAVESKDPRQVLEAVAGLVGQRIEYWSAIDSATAPEEQRLLANRLSNALEHEASKGYINEHERAAAQRALEGV